MFSASVIGGGPAGASAALGLLRNGFRVTLYEQRPAWNGRVCGSFLNNEAVRHLEWLDIFNSAKLRGGLPVTHSTLSGGAPVELNGFALPRKELESLLLNAVEKAGGIMAQGTRVTPLTEFSSDLTVMADGRFTMAEPTHEKPGLGWYGWNATFAGVRQKPGEMSMHFYPGGYVGVLTFNDGLTNVCGLKLKTKGSNLDWNHIYDEARDAQPSFQKIMMETERTSDWKGVGPLPFSKSMRQHKTLCLVGDAAAVGDPFMGEGIGRALAAGPMISEAWQSAQNTSNPLEYFHAAYRKLWQNVYPTRLRLGFWSRAFLGNPMLFKPAMPIFLRQRQVIHSLLPIFHRGFQS